MLIYMLVYPISRSSTCNMQQICRTPKKKRNNLFSIGCYFHVNQCKITSIDTHSVNKTCVNYANTTIYSQLN